MSKPKTPGDMEALLSWGWLIVLVIAASSFPRIAFPVRLTLYAVLAFLLLTNAERLGPPLYRLAAGLKG